MAASAEKQLVQVASKREQTAFFLFEAAEAAKYLNSDLTTCKLLVLSMSSDSLFPFLRVPQLLILRQTSHEVRIIVD